MRQIINRADPELVEWLAFGLIEGVAGWFPPIRVMLDHLHVFGLWMTGMAIVLGYLAIKLIWQISHDTRNHRPGAPALRCRRLTRLHRMQEL
jgi:hypothetical protein